MANIEEKRCLIKSKIGYATGDILGGGAFTLISLLFLNFLTTMEGINIAAAGTIVLLAKIWDAVTDPLMGMISDRTKSRFGRRRVYLLVGIIPIILTFTMMWYSFGIKTEIAKIVYYGISYILFSTAFTVVMVPYNSLLPEMIVRYERRCKYMTIRMGFSMFASLISSVLPGFILGSELTRTRGNFLTMGIVFGLIYGLPLILTFLFTWEDKNAKPVEGSNLKDMLLQFGESFKNKAYRQYLGIFLFGGMSTDIITAVTAFWLFDCLAKTGMVTPMAGIMLLTAFLFLPLNSHISQKWGKQYPLLTNTPFRLLGLIIAFFIGEETSLWVLIFVAILVGIGTSAATYVPWNLLQDLPDADQALTGQRREGIYAGTASFIRKFTSGIAIWIVSILLQCFGFIETNAGEQITQTATAILGIRLLFSIVPIIFSIITMILAWQFVMTKKNAQLVQQAIKIKQETGKPTQDVTIINACEKSLGLRWNELWVSKL